MKPTLASIVVTTLLLAACGREQTNSDGNGPGTADGFGGREDPPTAPVRDAAPSGDSGAASETDTEGEIGSNR